MTQRNPALELIDAARAALAAHGRPGVHYVGAALRTRSGKVFSAVNLGTTVGRASVCAEACAVGMAAAAGDTDIETIVAVNDRGNVVAPCGICRELIADYAPAATVIVPEEGGIAAVSIGRLLPNRFTKG